tara:strand:- start:377 stop:595 length:219 start_codon:yes stop_codon:yes gene_type:complete
MGKWMSWMNGLGDVVVHVATTLPRSKMAGPDGVVDTGVIGIGFLVAQVVNMDAATEIAQSESFAVLEHLKLW